LFSCGFIVRGVLCLVFRIYFDCLSVVCVIPMTFGSSSFFFVCLINESDCSYPLYIQIVCYMQSRNVTETIFNGTFHQIGVNPTEW